MGGMLFLLGGPVLKKNLFMTLVKEGKADFIRGCGYHKGVLQQGTEIGLNAKYNKEKWGFMGKEQGGGQWMENY